MLCIAEKDRPLWGRKNLAQLCPGASGLSQAACRDGVTVAYKRMSRLFEELELAHGPSRACLHALPGSGRTLSAPVPQHHQSTAAHPG
jgi:hypothetical protein